MSEQQKKVTLRAVLIALAIAVVIAGITFYLVWAPLEHTPAMLIRSICDAFFVSGFVFLSFGLLTYATYTGALDIFGFSMLVFKNIFKRHVKHESYADYKARKKKERRSPLLYVVLIGAAFIVISIILMIIYLGIR